MVLVPVGAIGTATTDDVLDGETFSSDAEGVEATGTMPNNGSGDIGGPNDTLSGAGYYSSISNSIPDHGNGYIDGPGDTMSGAGYYDSITNNIIDRGVLDINGPYDDGNSGYYDRIDNNIADRGSIGGLTPGEQANSGYYSSGTVPKRGGLDKISYLSYSNQTVYVLEYPSFELIASISGIDGIRGNDGGYTFWGPDNEYLLVKNAYDATTELIEISSGNTVASGSVIFGLPVTSPRYTLGYDKTNYTLGVYDVDTNGISEVGFHGGVTSEYVDAKKVEITSDGEYIVVSDYTPKVWDADDLANNNSPVASPTNTQEWEGSVDIAKVNQSNPTYMYYGFSNPSLEHIDIHQFDRSSNSNTYLTTIDSAGGLTSFSMSRIGSDYLLVRSTGSRGQATHTINVSSQSSTLVRRVEQDTFGGYPGYAHYSDWGHTQYGESFSNAGDVRALLNMVPAQSLPGISSGDEVQMVEFANMWA